MKLSVMPEPSSIQSVRHKWKTYLSPSLPSPPNSASSLFWMRLLPPSTRQEKTPKRTCKTPASFSSRIWKMSLSIHEGWEKKKLGDLCHLITDGKHGDCQNEENSGYYFLSAKDIKNGTFNYEDVRQIARPDFEETHRRTDLRPGDVLITNSGTIGRMAIAPNEDRTFRTTFQKSVAIIKPISSKIDNMFCYYQLKADLTKLVNVSAGTAQKNLLIGDLKNYFISFPESLPEQHAIVAKLDAISLETKKLEAIYQKKLVDLDEMKKSILQKAFNGELTN
jgi:restriction endonuclease S subunit